MHDGIEKPLFQQEFRPLKAFRQLLTDGLLDHARSCKANQRAWLGDVQVAEHGKAGRDPAGRRVGEHADVGHLGVVQLTQRGGDFGHLHQAHHALHHARPA
jgi:hypothetical protein